MGFCGKNPMFLCRQNPRQFCCTSKFVISMEKTESRGQWYPTSREKRARYGAPGVRGGGRKSGYAIATGVLMGWRAPKLMKTPSVQRPLFMEPSPSPLSSRPKRTQISYLAALTTATHAAFRKRKAHRTYQRHQVPQEIWGSVAEGSAVPRSLPGNVFRPSATLRSALSFLPSHRSYALYQGTTLVGPLKGLMRP